MTLGEKIQMLRVDAGLSQEALAERLGVSRQAISKWELDKTVPEVKYILALSGVFSVTTDYLLKEEPLYPERSLPLRDPDSPSSVYPVSARMQVGCMILGCGNVVLLMLLLFSVCKFALWNEDSYMPLGAILVCAPVLAAVSAALLWEGPLPTGVERRFLRGIGSAVILMGFAVSTAFGYHEVVEDLVLDQVMGYGSIPLFFAMTAGLMLLFWLVGCLAAHFLLCSLKHP